MNVRAKFLCVEKKETKDGNKNIFSYLFYPVTSGSDENKEFYHYTPSGKLELNSIKSNLFEVGKEFYLDFSLAK